jgi:hypothetical protein
MSKQHTGENKNAPENNSIPPVNAGNKETNHKVNRTYNSAQPTHQPQRQSTVFKRTIAFIGNKNNQTLIGNIISLLMVVVTAILAYYTWRVFNQTTAQTIQATRSADAAKISADAAKKSANLQKQALDSQIVAKKQSDKADAKKEERDIATFNLQKKGLDGQIASLKETQKEFDIENRPLIQIMGFNIDTLIPTHRIGISFYFKNAGK